MQRPFRVQRERQQSEREALRALESWGLHDLFRLRYDGDGLYSWWDYRAGNFHKGKGMRIDLMLGTDVAARSLRAMLIDRNARKGRSPSDHAPMVADFALDTAPAASKDP